MQNLAGLEGGFDCDPSRDPSFVIRIVILTVIDPYCDPNPCEGGLFNVLPIIYGKCAVSNTVSNTVSNPVSTLQVLVYSTSMAAYRALRRSTL